MPKIGIVTDSTADMTFSYYEDNDVVMVPLVVRFGEDVYKDWVEMPPKKFYTLLRSSNVLPKTSQPSVQEFVEAYNTLSDCDHIFSIHLSSKLSGTYQSADIARQNVSVPVTVVDSKLASIGTAFIVGEVARARDEGKSVEEISALIQRLVDTTKILFCVDTLKYLELGGRIGRASALVGSILNIKPILTLEDGVVTPVKKVKGRTRVKKEMVQAVKEAAPGRLRVGFIHAEAPEAAGELADLMRSEGIAFDLIMQSEIGSVIGTYVGPGTFGVMFCPE